MTTPKLDGFFMPAEYEEHEATFLLWPYRLDNWREGGVYAKEAFAQVIHAISQYEKVLVGVIPEEYDLARSMLEEAVQLIPCQYNDAWARDIAPTFVSDGQSIRAVNWGFNAWGGAFDGLYQDWSKDLLVKETLCKELGTSFYSISEFILEGGAIHVDGEGTAMVTEACLLSPGRNPHLTKVEIEEYLKGYLNVNKVLWLPHGVFEDETNEHVDNICAFVKPGEVILGWTEDQSDPQYAWSKASYDYLKTQIDAKGRPLVIHLLPMPSPIYLNEAESKGYEQVAGTLPRTPGMRLAASYANFYICNGAVIVPQFHDPNDSVALELLQTLFPERKAIGIYSKEILFGGGNIHCITQQIPKRRT